MRKPLQVCRGIAKSVLVHAPLVLSGAVGCALAFWRFGTEVIYPENISWFRGDSVWHFLSWNFFRDEPWSFPPGRIEHFLAPLGTSIGGGDALPLLAFPLKVFSAFLPADFQYLGFWLLINHILQGVFGFLLVRTFCRQRWLALLASIFFLFSPIMIFRAGHIALSAHWLVLFALWHYFTTAKRPRLKKRTYTGLWLIIIGLVGLVHPYLAAMVFPLAFISILHESWHRKRMEASYAATLTLGLLVLLGLEWWLSGIFGLGKGGGFEFFTLSPNALINPLDHSRFLPTLPIKGGQYEGFAYLGLGVLMLSAVPLLQAIRYPLLTLRQAWDALLRRGHLPLLLLCVGFCLFSLGNTILFILEVVALFILLLIVFVRNPPAVLGRLSKLPFRKSHLPLFLLCIGIILGVAIPLIMSTYRSPGRFIWPVYYLIYLSLMIFLFRRFSSLIAALLLLIGLVLQISDLKVNRPFRSDPTIFTSNLKSEQWAEVIRPFTTIAVIPPFERSIEGENDYMDFAFLASKYDKRVTTGVLARIPSDLERITHELIEQALSGPRDANTLYVFGVTTFTSRYKPQLKSGLRCFKIDAYVVCYSEDQALEDKRTGQS